MSVKFSLIIPCYNTALKDLDRLLSSVTRQGICKDDLQVIIVDDGSTDTSFYAIADSYEDLLNIEIHVSDYEMHCPSNSRRFGMQFVKNEWVCFCDHDDFFEDNAFSIVRGIIEQTGEQYLVCTLMRSWDEENDKYTVIDNQQAWLHGKFYNMKNLCAVKPINFKKDLISHEDIYFNSAVGSVLFSMNRDFLYHPIPTYRWVENPNSVSRRPRDDRGYMFENFNDYIIAASEPFFDGAKSGDDMSLNQFLMTLLHAYFYYETASYHFGAKDFKDCLLYIRDFMQLIMTEFDMSSDDIVNYVYSDPARYNLVRRDCDLLCGDFIEKTSFRNFIYFLNGEIDLKKKPKKEAKS